MRMYGGVEEFLTTWFGVILEKSTVAQLLRLPAFYGIGRFNTVHKSRDESGPLSFNLFKGIVIFSCNLCIGLPHGFFRFPTNRTEMCVCYAMCMLYALSISSLISSFLQYLASTNYEAHQNE
jgi:hypothetical protein